MMNLGTFYPIPLESYPKNEQEQIARMLMDEYIEQNYREGGMRTHLPLESSSVRSRMDRIAYCRALWNNELSDHRYDYLYNKIDKRVVDDQSGIDEIITMEMPAKVRNIPIIRPKLQSLISEEMARPIVSKVIGVSQDTVDKKIEKIKNSILERQMIKIKQKHAAQQVAQEIINTQRQLMSELPQDNPQAKTLIAEMQVELEYMQNLLNKDIVLTQDESNKIKEYYQYSFKEFEEQLASQALEEYIDVERLRHLMNNFFEESMISGEPIWYCNWEPGMTKPEVRLVRPEFIWYQSNEAAKYLHELDWVVEYMPLSIGQVIQYFGAHLTQEQLDQIRTEFPNYSQDAYYRTNLTHFPDGTPSSTYHQYDYLYSHEVDVYRVFWKEQVEVYALYSENKHDSPYFSEKPPFVKFLDIDEYKELTNTEAKKERLKRKGQVIKKAYRVDLWSGIKIGKHTYTNIGKCDFQYRMSDKISDVPLPYIGYANNRFYKAYSPVWETKDIQELYNILHYQEELLIALSGVKGMIYDLSQMPSGMSPQEIMYYMKQGLGLIETVGPNGKPKRTSFNQFSTYDMTVSPAIQYISAMKIALNELAGEITGATRQKTGQVLATDQVGTTQIALQQSNIVTEYYFIKTDELNELLFTRLCNIFPYAYSEGKKGMYVVGKERQEILNINKEQLKGEFRVVVNSGSKEREILAQAKQIAQSKMANGQLETSQYLDILDTNNMFEMRNMLREYEKQALEKAQMMQSNQIQEQKQAQIELEQMKLQMTQQLEQMSGQIQSQLIQLQGQIELQKEQVKSQTALAELQAKAEIENIKNETNKTKIQNERDVEMGFLEFNYNELQVNNANQRAQMLINRAKTALQAEKSKKVERLKD